MFDLIIFDEASQVGRAQSLALATLAGKVVYAVDPKQLSPIVQSKDSQHVTRRLGFSMFEDMNPDSITTCFLNEQSRMSQTICRTVSRVFYEGRGNRFPLLPPPRRQLPKLRNSCVTLTHPTAQKMGTPNSSRKSGGTFSVLR